MFIQQLFYYLGILYFSLSLIILLAIVLVILALYQKIKKLQQEIPQKLEDLSSFTFLLKHKHMRKLFPLFSIIPIILKATKAYSQSQEKSSK